MIIPHSFPIRGQLREWVLQNTEHLRSLVTEARRLPLEGKYLSLLTGDRESRLKITREGDRFSAVFTYPLDTDQVPSNGRIYVDERFEWGKEGALTFFDRSFHSSFFLSSPPWKKILETIKKVPSPSPQDPAVKKFFRRVLIPFVWQRTGQGEFSSAKNVLDRANSFLSWKNSSRALQVDDALTHFLDDVGEARVLLPLGVAQTAFRFAQGALLSLGKEMGVLSWALSSAGGVLAEAAVFEGASQAFQGLAAQKEPPRDFFSGFLHNLFLFAPLRGIGLLRGGEVEKALSSLFLLHGLQEIERSFLKVPVEGDWVDRFFKDTSFFLKTLLSAQLLRDLSGGAIGDLIPESQRSVALIKNIRELHPTRFDLRVRVGGGTESEGRLSPFRDITYRLDPFKTSWIIGRSSPHASEAPDVALPLEDLFAFSRHARITFHPAGHFIIEPLAHPRDPARLAPLYRYNWLGDWLPIEEPTAIRKPELLRVGPSRIIYFGVSNLSGDQAPDLLTPLAPEIGPGASHEIEADSLTWKTPTMLSQEAPLRVLNYGDKLVTNAPNREGSARRARVNLLIPNYGEASAFTHEGIDRSAWLGQRRTSSFINEDAFGIATDEQGHPLFLVTDGFGSTGAGGQASAEAIMTVMSEMNLPRSHLGGALLAAHQELKSSCCEGATAMSAVRIGREGEVELAQTGHTRVWILRPKEEGHYQVVEPFLPDHLAAWMRSDSVFSEEYGITDTLSMNASEASHRVLSGLGISAPVKVVSEFVRGRSGQILHSSMIPDLFEGSRPMAEREPYRLQEGDVVLLMSDGVANLFTETDLADTLGVERRAVDLRLTLQKEVERRLTLFLDFARGLKGEERALLPDARYIASDGKIYSSADPLDTTIIGYIGPDNVTALVYRHGG